MKRIVRNRKGKEGRRISHFDPFAEEAQPTVSSQMATTGKPVLTKIDLKLLMDKSRKRVLFAEAGKEFVDFLFGLLELPLGSILKLLVERGMVKPWSMSRVYESVQSLDNNYLQSEQTKFPLLQPKIPSSNTKRTPLLQELAYGGQMFTETFLSTPSGYSPTLSSGGASFPSSSSSLFGAASLPASSSSLFRAASLPASSSSHFGATSSSSSLFGATSSSSFLFGATSSSSSLFGAASRAVERAAPSSKVDGYVREIVTYMVMDDLTVKPMSTVTSITLLNTLQVRDIGCLEEKMVKVDMEKAIKLVKASFESTTVLTDVFLSGEV